MGMYARLGGLGCLLLVLAAGCGRIGFDLLAIDSSDSGAGDSGTASGDGDGGGGPAEPSPDGGAGPVDDGGTQVVVDDAGAVDAGPPEGAACGAHAQGIDYCQGLPAMTGRPRIDGELDCGLPLAVIEPVGWTADGPVPASQSARFAAGWLPEGLYVYIEVTDPQLQHAPPGAPPWQGDGVEVYVDDDGVFADPVRYDAPGTVQVVAAAPRPGQLQIRRGERYRDGQTLGVWVPDSFVSVPVPGGYVLEALIGARDLDRAEWTLADGQRLGLNLSINLSAGELADGDDDDAGVMLEGERLGQYFLRVGGTGCAAPFCDVGSFCSPTLMAD